MNRNERVNDAESAFPGFVLPGWQAAIWTALPAIVQSFNAAAMTLVAQPAIQAYMTSKEGVNSWATLPLCVDVPVIFPSGGGFTLTYPIHAGDECLLVFSSRCIDQWWQSGQVSVQAELRMHDLSDGFALVGPRSQPRVLSGISTTAAQLRNDTGTCFVEVGASNIVLTAPGDITLNAGGAVTINSGAAGVTVNGGTHGTYTMRVQHEVIYEYHTNPHSLGASFAHLQEIYNEHVHDGVTIGTDDTEPPTPLLDWWPV